MRVAEDKIGPLSEVQVMKSLTDLTDKLRIHPVGHEETDKFQREEQELSQISPELDFEKTPSGRVEERLEGWGRLEVGRSVKGLWQ